MHARFSERTRYLRYFSPYPRIPARDLERFVTVDHRDREAFVVASGAGLIAVGRYERLGPQAPDAEVAFVVADEHQGRGIGSVLLEHLAAAAEPAGITRFVAEVLPENGAMLRVFADAGYQVQRAYADGVVHLTFPIAPTERRARSRPRASAAPRPGPWRGCSSRGPSRSTGPPAPGPASAPRSSGIYPGTPTACTRSLFGRIVVLGSGAGRSGRRRGASGRGSVGRRRLRGPGVAGVARRSRTLTPRSGGASCRRLGRPGCASSGRPASASRPAT